MTLNKKKQTLKTNWTEITLNEAVSICSLELPEIDITDPAAWMSHTRYCRDVIAILSDMSSADLDRTNANDILTYFTTFLLPIVVDLHSVTPVSYEPEYIKSFEFGGVTYMLPESLRIESDVLPMYSSQTVDFIESSNIMAMIAELKEKGINYMSMVVAIVCRPDGEKYDEKTAFERSKQFSELPMSVVWEVFFCIQQLTLQYSLNILNYTRKQMSGLVLQLRVQVWFRNVTQRGYMMFRKLVSRGTWRK